jgi:hypothetical protein
LEKHSVDHSVFHSEECRVDLMGMVMVCWWECMKAAQLVSSMVDLLAALLVLWLGKAMVDN